MSDAFHTRHEELYTYSLRDQEAVLINARAAVIGALPNLPQEPALPARAPAGPHHHRRVYLGSWQDVPVFSLDALAPGQIVEGPAVVESATTTVLLRGGDRLERSAVARRAGPGRLPDFDMDDGAPDALTAAVVPIVCH
jgi:N-methylhydantoinase A